MIIMIIVTSDPTHNAVRSVQARHPLRPLASGLYDHNDHSIRPLEAALSEREHDPERHLPLKPVEFHVLLALTDVAMHGYGMVKEIEARSEGLIRLEPGNLYRHLRRLVDQGLVEPAGRRPVGANDERRRYYCITTAGRRVLAAEAARMRRLAAAAESRTPRTSEGGG